MVRLLARKSFGKGSRSIRGLTTDEIVEASGLPRSEVLSLSFKVSWDDVPVSKMKAFCQGCGIDFASRDDMRRYLRYLDRSPTFTYLKGHPEKALVDEIVRTWIEERASRS